MSQHRSKTTKEKAAARRMQEIQRLYSLQTISPVTEKTHTNITQISKHTNIFLTDKKHLYRDLLKTLIVVAIILVLEIALWKYLRH